MLRILKDLFLQPNQWPPPPADRYRARLCPTTSASAYRKPRPSTKGSTFLLLADRLSSPDFKTFHFAFYFMPRDLFRWVNDLHDCAELGQQQAQEKAIIENRKMFVWPEVCQKGKKLDAPFTLAYKTFCNETGLNKCNFQSQTEFRVRVRATWLRLVACYSFEHGLLTTNEEVAKYLEKAHAEEVDLQPTDASSGPRTTVVPVNKEAWSIMPDSSQWGTEQQRRRVLVYGAPLANPYLCCQSLE